MNRHAFLDFLQGRFRKTQFENAGIDALPVSLKRNEALVPVDSAASRALAAVIAILTFLAGLCAGGAQLVASSSAEWRSSVSREATIQIKPVKGRSVENDIVKAIDLARKAAGVAQVQIYSKADSEKMLEPWLGTGLDLVELPIPRLIVLKLQPGLKPDFSDLRKALLDAVPNASLDDHRFWLSRLSAMANTVVAMGIGLVGLVLTAAGLAVIFATRGAMAGNKDIVEILHFVGADDRFIAQEFQQRFLMIGLKGGSIGGICALVLFLILGIVSAAWRLSPQGDQIEALFGAFEIGWTGVFSVIGIALLVSCLSGIVSRIAVRRYLKEPA